MNPLFTIITCFVQYLVEKKSNFRCPSQPEIGIVAELQVTGGPASEHDRSTLITRAWTKIPLFDNNGRLIAGRFRIPLRNVPIKPYLHTSQLSAVPRVNPLVVVLLYCARCPISIVMCFVTGNHTR